MKTWLPVIPLRDLVAFPTVPAAFSLSRLSSVRALESALASDKRIFLAAQRSALVDDPGCHDIHAMGCICEILQNIKMPGGDVRMLVKGLERARVTEWNDDEGFYRVAVHVFPQEIDTGADLKTAMDNALSLFDKLVELSNGMYRNDMIADVREGNPATLADTMAAHLVAGFDEKQSLLETLSTLDRLNRITSLLKSHKANLQVDRKKNEGGIQLLRCSFCNKSQEEVAKLISGPNVLICDECVGVCNDILANRSQSTAGPAKPSPPALHLMLPRQAYDYLSERVVGQEKPKRSVSVSLYKHIRRLELWEKGVTPPQKDNILLIGPTGTGKTLLATTLAEILDVPFVACDATTLTEAGYIGDDVETSLSQLYAAAENDVERTQRGVIFIDEIDKIARRPTRANRDISGEGAQRGLLKMLGGAIVHFDHQHRNRQPNAKLVVINTAHILFVCAGAFAGLSRIIQRRLDGDAFGKSEDSSSGGTDSGADGLLQFVTGQDLVMYGFLPEFVARFATITVFSPLDRDSLIRIVSHPTRGVAAEYRSYFAAEGIELEFEDSAIAALVERSLAEESGARGLRSVVSSILDEVMFEIVGRRDVRKCIIHRGVIEERQPPILVGEDGGNVNLAAIKEQKPTKTTPSGRKRRPRNT